MRFALLAFSLTLAAALAGCTDSGSDDPTDDAPVVAALPEGIYDNATVIGEFDPFNSIPAPAGNNAPCSTDVSGCTSYPFTVNRTAAFEGSLTWTLQANDFDFYIFQDGQVLFTGANSIDPADPNTVATTSEAMSGELAPGAYEVVVVSWFVAQDTYSLAVTFAEP